MNTPRIVVLAGGTSPEREVSLGSGKACAIALARLFPTVFIDVTVEAVPPGIDPRRDVVFSTLHGTFGEDGAMQQLLDDAGISYAGCDRISSELTFDKERTKRAVAAAGGVVPAGVSFTGDRKPNCAELIRALGGGIVFKPKCGGSSVGLAICHGVEAIDTKLNNITSGDWLAEQCITGREVTVGILHGRALPVVEIVPRSGVFDYQSKYTKGLTEYLAPAPLSSEMTRELQESAERAFAVCGCRDYARIDFMITAKNECFLLEINTLPGMKETSLLPMGAKCAGVDFTALVGELVKSACERFSNHRKLATEA
ncbi:D-alanine--D-alanine ligase family protein [Synoicihabitans lomoniglobus]|uniref:D-alanine--D-alanine ligase n=1 Tax=Synoicihabitans lomoniglobus TaxID=2909285 RepID=A0AAF0CQF7_9BACT|nr:D-alanine--D-alanine ligase [Opitutaceae bacterium LMO-M01]WED66159.1 D-alanine--D-alanine ligase [Opitutaceae bacterium LMO-M01]